MTPPDPLPGHIAALLSMEGMHQDTELLIRLALAAQETGTGLAGLVARLTNRNDNQTNEPE